MIYQHQPESFDISFENSNDFFLVDVLFSSSIVEEMQQYFPEIFQTKNISIENSPCWITPGLKEIYNTLFNTPYTEQRRALYHKIKVRELEPV